MPTVFRWKKNCDIGNKHYFLAGRITYIYASSFKDGIVTVSPSPGTEIWRFARLIVRCFNPRSDFYCELLKAFECDENTQLKGIKCVFNDEVICIATKESTAKEIVEQWKKKMY